MISMAFDRQMEKIGLALPDQTEVAVCAENIRDYVVFHGQHAIVLISDSEQKTIHSASTNPDSGGRDTFCKTTRSGLDSSHYFQEIRKIRLFKKNYISSIQVIDKQVRGLFSEEKNNSALLSRELLRDYENSVPATVCKRKNTTAFEQELPGKKAKIEVN